MHMMSLTHMFLTAADGDNFVWGYYSPGLVALSVAVSIFLSWVALYTADIARDIRIPSYRHVTIAMAAFALGGGIWTMHFIGMLSFQLPASVHYAIGLTLVSLLPACAASWLALYMLARNKLTARQLVISGTLVGAGIGAMHYSGMAAMVTPLEMRYVPSIFALSIVIAVVLAILALWIRFGLRRTRLNRWGRLAISGVVMGTAISGMHYAGMAAARFTGEPSLVSSALQAGDTYAALALASLAMTVGMLVAALNGLIRSRQLFAEAENSKRRLRAIFDTAVDAIITINSDNRIEEFSHSAERLFGHAAAEVVGRNVGILMPDTRQNDPEVYIDENIETLVPGVMGIAPSVLVKHKDGSELPVRIAIGLATLATGDAIQVILVTDISERQALEISLRETAIRAEQAAAAKTTFLANMSHEIRTPMNSIIGFSDLVLQSDLTLEQRRHMDAIRQSSNTLLSLINDILDTTKLEHGRLELETRDFSLKEVAQQVESSLHLAAQASGLTLTTHYPAEMPEYFRGDPLRLQQVLTNLVNNAIKFTKSGGVNVRFMSHDGHVQIEVSDTGIGMTEDQVQSIFDPFSQADASISRRFGGTGLGTTISRQLVDIMGGQITVDSTLGQGSTFRVSVPLLRGTQPTTEMLSGDCPQLPPLCILVADDVALNRELLRETLESRGHHVVSAVDGAEAVEKCRTETVDVVLMDMHMPVTDGLQATRLIRQHERTHNEQYTPIIALTASVMAKDRHAARQAGMDGFAVKPLDLPRLFAEIARVLALEVPVVTETGSSSAGQSAVIDWKRGIALWGDRSRLAENIYVFLDNVAERHPLPVTASTPDDIEQLIASLHGIKGAAGNLALTTVSSLAGELEAMARDNAIQQVVSRLPELSAHLAAAKTEARNHRAPRASEQSSKSDDQASGTLLRDNISALHTLLKHNEIDETLLDTVCTQLRRLGEHERARTLHAAIDDFDFDQARTLLDEWTVTTETAAAPALKQ